ncbi:MAG: SIR2 family protein [Desulfomonile tiedjei]|uniref:SIR2 family protein n=1 Tax=Desulfomonile tiedjei TaxID=2358 RepID=A0A9D6V3G5_9BACT|nr:SIR2 family protein [Desulfomonile tiedjei]
MPKRVSFLFGSGISIPAGMPSVTDITERVLSGKNVQHGTDGRFRLVATQPQLPWPGVPDEYVPRVKAFIERLYVETKKYYYSRPYYSSPPRRAVNYEDLYYVASQIYDGETGEYDNPIVQGFVDQILPDVEPFFARKERLLEIARDATYYIFDIVWDSLKSTKTINYLNCIEDACRDKEISPVDLFTLNHDTLLEQYLESQNIKFTAGFEARLNGYRYWSPQVFRDPSDRIRLFKLHGSVNWFRYEPNVATGSNDPVGIADDGKYWQEKDPNGRLQFRDHDRPVLLVGTFNKIFEYTSRIFADLFYEFRHSLQETDLLIVSGYGFGDQGINMQVAEWADSSDKAKMIVIDPGDPRMGARGNIRLRWDGWLANKKLVVIPKWIEHTSWKDIQSAIQRV